MLLQEAKHQRIQKARKTYEKLVEKFPTCGRYWKVSYIFDARRKLPCTVRHTGKYIFRSTLSMR